MKPEVDYSLYLVTDRDLMSAATLEEAVEEALLGGCTLVQLREKDASSLTFFEQAQRILALTKKHGVPMIINDRVDIALAADADGVHVGQSDLPAEVVRRLIGPEKLLGVSAATVEEAVKAERDGADYIGVGAMYATGTKTDTRPVSVETLREIRAAVTVPIVVIGGINAGRVAAFRGTGINGLAVVSAILAAKDIRSAAEELKAAFRTEV